MAAGTTGRGLDHHKILRREFDRIANVTNLTWHVATDAEIRESFGVEESPKFALAAYKDWAGLLLRYHDAIERISKDDGSGRVLMPTMKSGGAE